MLAIIATMGDTRRVDNDIVMRVRELITRTGPTQQEFAERIGLQPDKLSKSLNGHRNFSSFELAAIADVAHTTVDWILSGQAPPVPAVAARAQLDEAINPDAIADVARRFADAHEQLSILGEERALPGLPAVGGRGSYLRAGDELAAWAHAQLADQDVEVVDLDQASLIGAVEACFGIDAAVVDLPPGLDGYAWQTETVRLLIVGCTEYWSRQRFSIAHELGHLLARDAQELIAESVDGHGGDWTEKRANAFAAGFLMPEQFLRRQAAHGLDQAGFDVLVSRLLVSPATLGWRLFNLELISDEDRQSWSRSTAERSVLRAGRPDLAQVARERSLAERLPPRLVQGHLRAFSEGASSVRPLASLLRLSPRDALETYGQQ